MAAVVLELPEEILEQIAEALSVVVSWWGPREEVLPHFKTFRLICKRFSQCKYALKLLFTSVHLRPDPEGYQLVQQTNTLSFADCVERVTFIPPQHSTALTLDIWKEIVTATAACDCTVADKILAGFGSFAYTSNGHRIPVKKHVPRSPQTSESATRLEFEEHLAKAETISTLLKSDELRNQWATTLRAFQNCQAIRFARWESIAGSHKHDKAHKESTCHRLAAPMGELVFAAAIESLARAGTHVKTLHIECAANGEFGWDRVPEWQDLDLSQLETLAFGADFQRTGVGSRGGAAHRAALTVTEIMKKCSKSLTKFEIVRCSNIAWPSREVVPLPALREIDLNSCELRPYNFRRWMKHMSSLESLGLCMTYCSFKGYKVLFDTLKAHMKTNRPKRMQLDFDQLPATDWAELSLRYNLVELGDDVVNFDETTVHGIDDIGMATVRYITELSGWDNLTIRTWFDFNESVVPDEDGEDTDNES